MPCHALVARHPLPLPAAPTHEPWAATSPEVSGRSTRPRPPSCALPAGSPGAGRAHPRVSRSRSMLAAVPEHRYDHRSSVWAWTPGGTSGDERGRQHPVRPTRGGPGARRRAGAGGRPPTTCWCGCTRPRSTAPTPPTGGRTRSVVRTVTGWRGPKNPIWGTEYAGVVERVGPQVTRFAVGDRVFGYAEPRFGAHAELVAVAESSFVAPVSDGIELRHAAAATEGAHYALSSIRRAGVQAGDRVLVHGATGAIGSAAVQLLADLGADVIATVPLGARQAGARARRTPGGRLPGRELHGDRRDGRRRARPGRQEHLRGVPAAPCSARRLRVERPRAVCPEHRAAPGHQARSRPAGGLPVPVDVARGGRVPPLTSAAAPSARCSTRQPSGSTTSWLPTTTSRPARSSATSSSPSTSPDPDFLRIFPHAAPKTALSGRWDIAISRDAGRPVRERLLAHLHPAAPKMAPSGVGYPLISRGCRATRPGLLADLRPSPRALTTTSCGSSPGRSDLVRPGGAGKCAISRGCRPPRSRLCVDRHRSHRSGSGLGRWAIRNQSDAVSPRWVPRWSPERPGRHPARGDVVVRGGCGA